MVMGNILLSKSHIVQKCRLLYIKQQIVPIYIIFDSKCLVHTPKTKKEKNRRVRKWDDDEKDRERCTDRQKGEREWNKKGWNRDKRDRDQTIIY